MRLPSSLLALPPLLVALVACRTGDCRPPARARCAVRVEQTGALPAPRPSALAALLARVDGTDLEDRYLAVRALGCHDAAVARARLRVLLDDEEPMLRNAAARSLADLGEEDAAAALIANLHRDRRTYVTMDAIWHLRALFGTDLGYDPNRGYRHQTEKQAAWWAWWRARGHEVLPEPLSPDAGERAARRTALLADLEVQAEGPPLDEAAASAATKRFWTAAAEIAPSRDPDDVAAVRAVFGGLAFRRPDDPDLWNNFALAALNDGRAAEAEAAYQAAITLRPDDAGLRNDLGIAIEAQGRLADAEAAYREAARLAPQDDVARSNLADVLAAQGRAGEAIAAYREAERLAPEKWWYQRLWIRRLTGGEPPVRR